MRAIAAFLLCLVVSLSAGAARPTDGEPVVVLLQESGLAWREARAMVEGLGGRVDHAFPGHALVGSIPAAAEWALLTPPDLPGGAPAWDAESLVVLRGEGEARVFLNRVESGLETVSWSPECLAAARALLPRIPLPAEVDRTLRVHSDGTVEVLPPGVWEEPALEPEDRAPGYRAPEGIGNTWYHTGEYLAGDVAVAICRPESNGSGDGTNTENWTAGEVSLSLTELMAAMGQLLADAPRGGLTFVYQTEHVGSGATGTVDCDYEAVNYANFNGTVVLNVLGKLGYSSATAWERMHEWVNAARSFQGTDWAVGFFIVDNSAAGTGRASAYINGPTVWIFGGDSYKVYHHESGHSWGARDEYASASQSPTSLNGYTQDVDANSAFNDGTGYFAGAGEALSALMLDNINYMSPWTRGQVGIWDLDGDGVYEPLDVCPGVTIGAPTGPSWGPLQFTGQAWGGSLKVESGGFTSTDVTLGRIARVEWRMNGGPWDDAFPVDGAFDSSQEWYTFVTPPLRNWGHVFEVRARDNFGNVTGQFARYDITATGSPLANQGPYAAASVSPSYGSPGTTFTFDATGSWDLEDGTAGLLYQWDFEDDGVWDTPWSPSPTANWTYPVPGTYTARIAVVDRMGHGMGRPIQGIQVAPMNVPPVATFTVDRGLAFASSPVVFNFDASGSWDGEDAASSLQVRWDFEDDGVWDTSWSTTKTAAKDYSLTYAVNPGQESGNTYLYSGCSVNGYAQSFVAGTTSIGKAELFLSSNATCATPGGTLTVGLRSSLTGSWITSLTANQSSLNLGDWNLFDFPDATGLTVGNTYYLVALTSDKDLYWLADNANPYAGGQHHYSFNGGSSWSGNATYDHTFRIYDGALSTVPLTKSKAWPVRLEVKDSLGQTAQFLHHVAACGYDAAPALALSTSATSGTTATTFNLTASGSDPDSATAWDGMLHYRWDTDGDDTYETEFAAGNTTARKYSRAGVYQATCEVRDRYHATARASVTLSVAPIAGGIGLADRTTGLPATTDEREVDAAFVVAGEPQEVMLSESSSFTGASWQPYAPQVVHKLSAGAGGKTLYAKFRSGAGTDSGSVWASITYAPADPVVIAAKSGGDVRLTWNAVGAFDYSVYMSPNADFSSPTQFVTSPTTLLTLDHFGALGDGALWFYKVLTDPLP